MSSAAIEILILVAIAGFLFFRLRDVIGRKTGHDDPEEWFGAESPEGRDNGGSVVSFPGARRDVEKNVEEDISETVPEESRDAVYAAKKAEPGFAVATFLNGADSAYEWILMGFENGDKNAIRDYLSEDVYQSFAEVMDDRAQKGLTVDARFIGMRSSRIEAARFDEASSRMEIDMRFEAETALVIRNAEGEVVEGDPSEIRRSSDLWTFSRVMGSSDPNWTLIATGD